MENLSHSRPPAKLSSTNAAKRACNGGSFAGKNNYDDVFGGPPRFGTPSLSPRPEDYSEIFGGFHASRATSIPVLDLPVVEDEVVCFDVRSSGFDYSEVFGGFDGLDFPASFEELMRQANGGGDHDRDGDSSDEAWTPAETECLSDESDLSGEDQYSLNGDSYEPINSSMKFNISYHKTDQGRNQDMYKGVTRVAELHTLPEYAHVFEETIPLDKAHGQNPDVNVTNGDVNLEFPARRKREKHVSKMSNLLNGAVDEAMTTENLESKSGYARAESCSDRGFVTISEISLRTQPSDVPPPTRRPPMLDSNKVDCRDSQTIDSGKRAGDDSPPYFDVEIDAASAAAASAAAMREAMENAQAKFRSTKELMQRKRDGVQNHKIFPSKHDRMDKTEKLRITADESCDMDYKLLQRACEKGKSQEKISINDGGIAMITKMLPGSIEGEGHFNVSKMCMEDKHASKLQSSRGLYDISVADEWHEAAQFFELVRTDNLVSEQLREETLLLQNPKIHEPQQKTEKVATEGLKQQREIGEVTTVRLDNDLEKIERDLRLAKEAFWRPETKGRPEVEKQAVRIKVNEKKLGVPQDLSKLEENSTKSITTQHLSERGKRIAEANEAEKCGRIEIRLADSELEIDKVRTYTTCEDPKFQQKHGKLGEMPEKGYERKLVVDFEQSANDKMLKKSLEQEEKDRKLKEVRRREERKKKERDDHEREEKVQKERHAHLQEEEKKRREAREREKKEKREVEIREREEKEKKEQDLREAKQKEERELQRREEQENEENAARKKEEEKRKRDALEREERERKEMEAHKMEEEKRVREALIQQEQNVKVTEACNREEDEKRKRVLKREEQERKEREASKKEEVGKKEIERLEGEENERKLREAFEKEENARKEKEWRELEEEMIWKMALEQLENEKIVKQTFWPSENEEKKRENPEEEVLEKIHNQAHKIEEKKGIQTADLLKNGKPHGGKVNVAEIGRQQDHEKETNSELEEACGKDGIGRINTEFQRKEETMNLGVIDDEHVRGKEALDGDGEKKLEDETVHEEMREVKGEGDSYCSSQREQIMKNIKTAECNGDLGLEEKCLKVPDGAMGQDTYTKVDDAINHCETKTRTKFTGDEASINQRNSEEIMSTSRVGCNPENKRSKFTNEHSGGDMDATSNQLRKSENPVSMQAWKESIEAGKKAEAAQSFYSEGKTNVQKVSQQVKTNQATEKKDNNIREIRAAGQAARIKKEREMEMERLKKMEEAREREREREKDRMPVDKLTLEARDRAYAESRERKERTAVDRATPEAKNRTLADARERLEKACSEAREKSYTEARLRADRTVVDKADARERALGKAMAERASADTNERIGRSLSDIYSSSRNNEMRDNKNHQFQRAETFSGSRFPASSSYSGVEGESAQRCKARLDRYRRTAERAAKALEEKNMRDLLAQKEQAERHRLAETLDADVKRWSSGKEGNLRALLSTLQYILGPDSGWQPIPLTEVITSAAVKRAYRKATLCVHPDKLQQRGASIQQKYICEKVFDLLKEAWNKFSSEER